MRHLITRVRRKRLYARNVSTLAAAPPPVGTGGVTYFGPDYFGDSEYFGNYFGA